MNAITDSPEMIRKKKTNEKRSFECPQGWRDGTKRDQMCCALHKCLR